MAKGKNTLAGLVFDNVEQAREMLQKLQEIDTENDDVEIVDAALALKSEDGKISLEQTGDITAEQGALGGAAVGALAGAIVAGPVGLAAGLAGGAFGALYGLLRDTGVDDKYMKELARKLEPGKTILFVLYSGAWTSTGDSVADALVGTGVEHIYTTLPAEAMEAARQLTIAAQQRQSEAQLETLEPDEADDVEADVEDTTSTEPEEDAP